MAPLVKQTQFKLSRRKHTPGSAVQRFGNWRNAEPTVMVDNHRWQVLGKPDEVVVEFVWRKLSE